MAGIDVKTEKSIGHSTNLMLTEGTKYITDNKSSRMEDIQHVQKTLLLYYIPGYTADFTHTTCSKDITTVLHTRIHSRFHNNCIQ